MFEPHYDIAILGAGMAGLTLTRQTLLRTGNRGAVEAGIAGSAAQGCRGPCAPNIEASEASQKDQ